MANVFRSALELVQDLARGGYNPREYADLLSGGQDEIGRVAEGHGSRDSYISSHRRKQKMKELLKVPSGEVDYQTMAVGDPKYLLGRAISDYTGSSSGFYNTPFRRRKVEQLADTAGGQYKDLHTKKQIEANMLADYLGSNTIQKIAALGKSFYPSPVDFVTWRGIPPNSRTLKEHWATQAPTRTMKQVEEELAAMRTKLDKLWEDNVKTYGQDYDFWHKDAKDKWNEEVGKQNALGNEYQELSFGGSYIPTPRIEDFPLYDDYGSEAFLSTSVDRGSAHGFAAEDPRGIFKILVPEGTPIRPVFPYSEHDTEMEVLLPPRSLYERTGERTSQGDVPLLYTGRGRPKSDKYIGAALPVGLGLEAYEGYDESQ